MDFDFIEIGKTMEMTAGQVVEETRVWPVLFKLTVLAVVLTVGAYVPTMWHAGAKCLSNTGDRIALWWIASDISSKGIYSDPKSLTRTQDQDVTKEDALKAYWVASLKLTQALDQIDSVRMAVQE